LRSKYLNCLQQDKDDLDLQFEKIQADLDETAAKIQAAEKQYGFAPTPTKPTTGFARSTSTASPSLVRTASNSSVSNNSNVHAAQIKQLEDKVRLAEQKARCVSE